MSYAIEIKNLTKRFGEKTAVKDLNLQIKQGGIFALLGVNGAGKTTTIRMLTGLSKPTEGEAYVMGYSVEKELAKVKAVCDISPQDTSVAPNLTVRENLEFMAQIYGISKEETKVRVAEIIRKFSLEDVEKTFAKKLSGGWQRRVSIAMALISNPQVLFLDEPTLGLDVLARAELWDILRDIKKETTIVLTTHYMEEAEALSDEVAVMVNGEILAKGTVTELKETTGQDSLEKAFIQIAKGGAL